MTIANGLPHTLQHLVAAAVESQESSNQLDQISSMASDKDTRVAETRKKGEKLSVNWCRGEILEDDLAVGKGA